MNLKKPVFDYDNIEEWSPWIDEALRTFDLSRLTSSRANVTYIEDARNVVVNCLAINELSRILFRAFENFGVRLFHGTRVTDAELRQIREIGLQPLNLQSRRDRLISIFSTHPDWASVQEQFDKELHNYGPEWERNGHGRREDGCVHFCFSRAGLLHGCNHYLKTGAEIDICIAERLFPDGSGSILLQNYGTARIVSVVLPFEEAATAMNSYGFPSHGLPTLLDDLISAWAYRKFDDCFATNNQYSSRAAKTPGTISYSLIDSVETVNDDAFLKEEH